jgi:hypothetical protein
MSRLLGSLFPLGILVSSLRPSVPFISPKETAKSAVLTGVAASVVGTLYFSEKVNASGNVLQPPEFQWSHKNLLQTFDHAR